jgi:hypothetical protein
MAQPVWETPAGSLGTIPEGVFYSTPLVAVDPGASTVYFQLIAGQLPPGLQIQQSGLLAGVPQAVVTVQGVPEEVSRDVESKFAVRAYTKIGTTINRLADRTFTLTVTGQDAPEWITPAGQIAQYFDGSLVTGYQLQYTDTDPADTVIVRLVSGALPTGLTLSPTGLISGFIQPLSPIDAIAGFSRDGQGFSEFPYDFSTQSVNANYQFTLEVTDGKVGGSNLRTFSIFVWSRNSLTADNIDITADNTFITADGSPIRVPILLNPQGSIGTVRNDNFFAYKFNGLDLDGDEFEYILFANPALPGLTLDPNSGWLYGYIPSLGLTELTYDFVVRVRKKNSIDIISDPYDYSLTIIGPVDTDITWLTPANLGTIDNGATSTFYVLATNSAGISLQYRLVSGSDSQLPQGLELLSTGDIAGRVSFNTFALDLGSTTFDAGTTTFDMTFTFTVNAFSVNGLVSVNKTFSITVIREYNEPYENLYIQAMPPQNDRDIINGLLQNSDIFQTDLIYRPTDLNFGVARNVTYYHAYGLRAATLADYVSSLDINHYWKNLVLGQIEVAQAKNSAGEVIYEVVYSRIIDDLVNAAGDSVSKEVTLPYPINKDDSTEIATVYPNSLINMRDQVIDTVGQISNVLPLWMTSTQSTGDVLGYTPAWVIAYAKPGKGKQIAYYIGQDFASQLNVIDYEVDRYELDRLLSHNWDPVTDAWIPPAAETTFDIDNHYQLPEPNDSSFVFVGGVGYEVGDEIRVLGTQVGGSAPRNNITIRVNTVDEFGTIVSAFATGTAPLFSAGDIYFNVAGTNITGTGTGATWDIQVVPGEQTVFDGNSLKFIAPVDMYSNTQVYDKYLVFPRRNILV